MSGNLAAIRLKGCCCKKDEDDNPQPDECGSASSGAESDRATTAISAALDMDVTEFVVRNWLGGQLSANSPPGLNCVIWNGTACEFELPNGDPYTAYRCDGDGSSAGTRPFAISADYRGGHSPAGSTVFVCYNRTGNSNHVRNFVVTGTQCTCTTQGNCTACAGDSYTATPGGGGVLDQVSPNAREWRTYQRSTQVLPDHRVAEWTWRPGLKGIRTRTFTFLGTTYTNIVRTFCPAPIEALYFGGTPNVQANVPQVDADPAGMFVDVRAGIPYPYVNSRWGNADVGRLYVCADIAIRYYESYQNLGPGWLGEIRLFSIYREQHLDLRHRFTMLLPPGSSARWALDSPVPQEAGFPSGNLPTGFLSAFTPIPWRVWKPCTDGSDTVAGRYETLGEVEREYYAPFFDHCALSGYRRGEAALRGMDVS